MLCSTQDPADEGAPQLEAEAAPACIALVDASGGEEWLELVKGALLAALEALPPGACFGLATFARQVCNPSAHLGQVGAAGLSLLWPGHLQQTGAPAAAILPRAPSADRCAACCTSRPRQPPTAKKGGHRDCYCRWDVCMLGATAPHMQAAVHVFLCSMEQAPLC